MIVNGRQLKAARELLGWTQRDLAARVHPKTGGHPGSCKYWERFPEIPTGLSEPIAVRNYRRAFEAEGVHFTSEGGGFGVQRVPVMAEAAE